MCTKFCTTLDLDDNSKDFSKIRLSTTKGDGFNPDFCFTPKNLKTLMP